MDISPYGDSETGSWFAYSLGISITWILDLRIVEKEIAAFPGNLPCVAHLLKNDFLNNLLVRTFAILGQAGLVDLVSKIKNPKSFSAMSNNTTSAFLGSPPNTLQDYYIIRGLYRVYGLGDADPNVGSSLFPKQPANYVHETKTTELYFGLVMIILSVLITTIPRLVLRASNPGMVFGSDDWAIIVAAVSFIHPPMPGTTDNYREDFDLIMFA